MRATKQVQFESGDIHGLYYPEDVRVGQGISCTIKRVGAKKIHPIEYRVWRFSPFGVEVVLESDQENLSLFDEVEINVTVGDRVSALSGLVVALSNSSIDKKNIAGIRYSFYSNAKEFEGEKRKEKRWPCDREFMPTGVAPTPGKFNDYIFFKVVDISSGGMKILTSMRNKLLLPGMILNCSISLPAIGHMNDVSFEIVNLGIVEESGKNILSVGGKFCAMKRVLKALIGDYVFQFGPSTSPIEIKKENLMLSSINKGIEYSYAKTAEDYKEVLDLRKLTYGLSGKLSEHSKVGDIYDTRSRIVIGKYRGKIIASARITFCALDDTIEHEEYFKYPSNFPRKDQVCEIMRLCTHPDFRGSDLLLGLFRHVSIAVVQSGRRYAIGCATDELIGIYTKIGFEKTDITYNHTELNNKKHYVIIADVERIISGYGVDPITWNVVWRDVIDHLADEKMLSIDNLVTRRIGLYKLFAPLSAYLVAKRKKPRNAK